MPTYNRSESIVMRAVQSVLCQTYTDWELYVVDDNKDDNPYSELIEKALTGLNDARVHYLKMEKNSGACAARNEGIAKSKGEYIALLDDDDEWLPKRLEKQLPFLKEQKIGFSYSGMLVYNETTGVKKSSGIKFKNGNVYHQLLKTNFMGGCSNFIIKREALEECGGFLKQMPAAQDYELWIRLSQKYHVSSVAEDLVIFHIHTEDSIMKSLDRRIKGYRRILELYYDDIIKDKDVHSFQLYNLGKFLILNHENKEGFSLLKDAIKLKPYKAIYYIAVITYWKICYLMSGK